MKKTFIASTVLMLCASAFAQSTPNTQETSKLNISGAIDVGVENAGGESNTSVVNGRNTTSQLTFSGNEGLRPGLNATFKISTLINADTGESKGFGNNDMYVGLEGDAGKLRLGRSFDPVYTHALTANGTKGVSGYQTLGTALSDRGIRVSNQVLYITPSYYGLTGTVSYSPSEVNGAHDGNGLGIRYVRGPIEATYSASRSAAVNTQYVHQVAGAYNFGPARVLFTAQDDKNLSHDTNAYSLGVTAPMGHGLLWASYDIRQVAGNDNGQVLQAGYKYNLSKRTLMYGQVGAKNSAFNGESSKGVGIGLAHTF